MIHKAGYTRTTRAPVLHARKKNVSHRGCHGYNVRSFGPEPEHWAAGLTWHQVRSCGHRPTRAIVPLVLIKFLIALTDWEEWSRHVSCVADVHPKIIIVPSAVVRAGSHIAKSISKTLVSYKHGI